MKSTRDYTIFQDITGNRVIVPAHVEDLATAIERKNLLEYFPILVNEKMEVIDGQHRLMAAAKLNVEAYYEVIPGLTIEDVMSINTNSRRWNVHDFIEAYIKLGSLPQYQILKDFVKEHKISPIVSAGLLTGYRGFMGGGSISQSIRNGTFRILDEQYANKIASRLSALVVHSDLNPKKDRRLIQTIMMLNANPDFDFERLIDKMQKYGLRIRTKANTGQYLLELEEIYNHNAKDRVELYVSTQKPKGK